jgi:hypothetical protein
MHILILGMLEAADQIVTLNNDVAQLDFYQRPGA